MNDYAQGSFERVQMLYHWDDIRFFLEAHRAGSLTGAARRLGVSHTTVARHIARLTDSLSVELFERGEGFRLTEAGVEILALAQRMEDAGTAIGDRLAGQGDVSGTVRIGAPDGFGNAFLSRALPRLAVAQPSMAFELVPVPRAHKLWKRDVDIAISLERPETGRVVRRKLVDYDLRLYGAPELLARMGAPESPEDLPRFPFVGYIGDLLYTDELDFNRAIHPDLTETYRAATVQAQLDAVRGGAGLGVLPSYMARERGVVPILPERVAFQRAYWLLIPEDIRDQPRIRTAADFIVSAVREASDVFRFQPSAVS